MATQLSGWLFETAASPQAKGLLTGYLDDWDLVRNAPSIPAPPALGSRQWSSENYSIRSSPTQFLFLGQLTKEACMVLLLKCTQ